MIKENKTIYTCVKLHKTVKSSHFNKKSCKNNVLTILMLML